MTTSYTRLLTPPKGSFFLLGPRGTGKTTWLRSQFPNAHRIDLLDTARYQLHLADAAAIERELAALRRGSWVVIDEIQRLPDLLNEVHRKIESHALRFALTGSSARKLRRGGVNLLGGRAARRTMYPFAPSELGDDFRIDTALRWGTLPVVWSAAEREETLDAYAQMYLREEIQAEAVVRNLPGFARFLPIAGLFHGQVVNVSAVARDAGVARTTVSEYVTVLEDTLVATRLEAFESKLRVRERKHPKLYWIDPGVARAMKRVHGPVPSEERGVLFEGYVHMLLRLHADLGRIDIDRIGYWSPADSATEVDFVVTSGKEHVAIEAKSGTRVREEDFRGLRAIADLPGLRRRVIVHPGDARARSQDGIEAIGVREFDEILATGRLFEAGRR